MTAPPRITDVHRRRQRPRPSARCPWARDRSRSASTASPTRRGPGSTCCPSSPTPASGPSPRSCGATRRRRSPPTASTSRVPSRPMPTRCTRRSAATATPCSSATTGERSPPTARRATSPRWRRVVAAAVPPPATVAGGLLLLRPAPQQLVHVLLPVAAGRDGRADGRPRLHRSAVGRLVAGVRRRRPSSPGARSASATPPTSRRARLLPGHHRRRAATPELDAVEAAGALRPPDARRCTSTAPTTAAWAPTSSTTACSPRCSPPRAPVEEVPGAGHFLHLERPFEVNRLIVDFVTS
jgi:hypothetical protein